jgi:N-acetylglucosaminyl-diphospho-decaprenol L-rhamnosyltransferase
MPRAVLVSGASGRAATLDVIIVNYNTRDLLDAALRSLDASVVKPDTVWVVDNGSTDGSAEMVSSEYPRVRLITSDQNVGFARGNNLAFERSNADLVLLLNSDAEVELGTIGALVAALVADPGIGAAGPVLVSADGSVQYEGARRDPSVLGEFSNITHLNRAYPGGALGRYMMNDWDHLSTRVVEVLSGACMLLRREALDGLLFRDDFFMYGEDVELCQRLRDAGWRLLYESSARVLHHGGAASTQARLKMRLAGVVSMAQLLARRRGPLYSLAYLAIVPVAWPLGAIVRRTVLKGRSK